ncbi:nuclear pore protein [Scheffersomyces xylosifermentans]|uniref:nuclear pore protein n=1 Tax=Scheffersomyces xylosifermentans TaxID=1304137 RepID=UPI00315D2A95
MDVTYSVSNVVGFKDHLQTQAITLPLKYPTKNEVKTPKEEFHNQLADSGSILDLSASKSFIDFVSCDVLNDLKTITLTPINANVNNFDLTFQSLQIALPHRVISSKSFSVIFDSSADPEGEDGFIVLDLIDENYLFITLKISLADFIVSGSSNRRAGFSLSSFDKWGQISVPYSFELRSSPFLLKSVDPLNIIVSLKDGGLLHFRRSKILGDVEARTFSESTSLLPLNFISGIFRRDPKQEIILEGISSNAIVDVISLNHQYIATLTVRKVLKVWSLRALSPAFAPIELTELADAGSWLTSFPAKYLQIYTTEDGKKSLSLYYSTNSNDFDNTKSRYVFKSWEITTVDNKIELTALDDLTFQPELPNSLLLSNSEQEENNFQNTLWFIQDYQTQFIAGHIKFHILWKSNTSSILVTYTLSFSDGSVVSINWSSSQEGKTFEELGPYHDADYYYNKILNSGRYNNLIVYTSLNVFREYKGLEPVDKKKSIRDSVEETIKAASNLDQYESKMNWFKLESLCEEFKKLGEEDLALSLTAQSYLLTLQVNGLSILRPSHYYESFSSKKKTSPEGKLAGVLNKLNNVLSTKTFHRIHAKIRAASKLSPQSATEWYNSFIGDKLSDEDTNSIIQELELIPNAFDLLDSLIGSIDFENIPDIESSKYTSSLNIPPAKKLNTIVTFKNIIARHKSILLNLFVLFLVCDNNDQILLLLNKIIDKLNTYDIIGFIFDTSFKKQSKTSRIENNELNNTEKSLFWTGIVDNNPQLNYLIRESRMNEACDYFIGTIISSYQNFIVDVTLDLLNRDEGKFIKKTFFKNLNLSRVVDRFIIGLVHLVNNDAKEFFDIFESYEAFDFTDQQSLKEKVYNALASNVNIKIFLDVIFSENPDPELKKSEYFHALSELSRAQAIHSRRYSHHQKFITPALTTTTKSPEVSKVETNFTTTAIEFESKAISILEGIVYPEEDALLKIQHYYLNLFELALGVSNFDVVYEALSHLSPKNSNLYDYTELFTRFIHKLIADRSISIIFPPHPNALYRKNFLLIDSILLSIANNELTLSSSLKLYEYLYSWRLFGSSTALSADQLTDKRGAIESLYMFITRFKNERGNLIQYTTTPTVEEIKHYKLKILELYMIILNCLKGYDDEDDQWIIKQKDSNSLTIVKLEELKLEYHEWFNELEEDLKREF